MKVYQSYIRQSWNKNGTRMTFWNKNGTRMVHSCSIFVCSDRMKDNRVYDSDKILSTLRQCILDKPSIDTTDMTEEDKTAIEAEENEENIEFNPDFEDDRLQDAASQEDEIEEPNSTSKSKRDINTNCLINV